MHTWKVWKYKRPISSGQWAVGSRPRSCIRNVIDIPCSKYATFHYWARQNAQSAARYAALLGYAKFNEVGILTIAVKRAKA